MMYKTRMTTRFLESWTHLPDPLWLQSAYSLLRAGWAETSADHHIQRDTHPGQDILFCLSGRGEILSEGMRATLSPGQMVWLANEQPHGHRPDPAAPWSLLFARIDGPAPAQLRQRLFVEHAPAIASLPTDEVQRIFHRIFRAFQSPSKGLDSILNSEVAQLVQLVSAALAKSAPPMPDRLELVLAAMREAPQRGWTATELAAISRTSVSQMRRLFQHHLGLSPRQVLGRERVMRGQRLLLESDVGVSVVAVACGFYDVYHFSREFKKLTGLSPSAWRRAESGNA